MAVSEVRCIDYICCSYFTLHFIDHFPQGLFRDNYNQNKGIRSDVSTWRRLRQPLSVHYSSHLSHPTQGKVALSSILSLIHFSFSFVLYLLSYNNRKEQIKIKFAPRIKLNRTTIFTAGIVMNSCRATDKHSHHPIMAIQHIVSPWGSQLTYLSHAFQFHSIFSRSFASGNFLRKFPTLLPFSDVYPSFLVYLQLITRAKFFPRNISIARQ